MRTCLDTRFHGYDNSFCNEGLFKNLFLLTPYSVLSVIFSFGALPYALCDFSFPPYCLFAIRFALCAMLLIRPSRPA
jgi:hypothetical protein